MAAQAYRKHMFCIHLHYCCSPLNAQPSTCSHSSSVLALATLAVFKLADMLSFTSREFICRACLARYFSSSAYELPPISRLEAFKAHITAKLDDRMSSVT